MNETSSDYITTQEARRILDVTTQTLRKWDSEHKVRTIRTSSNQRRYHKQDIYDIIGGDSNVVKKEQVVYARVSSKKQMDDLARQVDFLRTKFPNHLVVTDVGSGINWDRKGIETILERALRGAIDEVVVAHKDRLCRFAFGLFERIFRMCKVRLIVLDMDDTKSTEQELADDLLSIVHIYSCRNMGRRRYTSKKTPIVPNSNPAKDAETVDGNDSFRVQSSPLPRETV
jgi:predicted site-specific integrase-resolvase